MEKAKKASVHEIEGGIYVNELAKKLKTMPEFKMPQWAAFVKTGRHKERLPAEEDWWWKRAASILRQLYIHKIVGVQRLRTRYGGRKQRGMRPAKFYKGAGKLIRVILQQAEAAGLVEKAKEKKAGRRLTTKGKEFLEAIAAGLEK